MNFRAFWQCFMIGLGVTTIGGFLWLLAFGEVAKG